MQFGGSFGPAVGQGTMECLSEIARQQFDTEDRRRVLAAAASHAGMKEWLEGRRQLALDMMKDDYDRIADKDTFFANQNMVKWKAVRWFKHTVEQQRLAVICGYIDDMHLTAVGRDRGFR